MPKIIVKKEVLEYTEEEFEIIQRLIEIALNFEKDTFQIFEDISIFNDLKNVKEAMREVITDEKEIELILRLNKDEELVEKIKKIYL